jgi:hypothetical protein
MSFTPEHNIIKLSPDQVVDEVFGPPKSEGQRSIDDFRNKKIEKPEGAKEEKKARFENGEMVLHYEGDWDDWYSHPDGVIIQKGNQLLLNGKDLLYEGDWDDWRSHPDGVIIRKGNQLLLNGKGLLYEGDWDNWRSHPDGVIIRKGFDWIFYNGQD